MTDITEHPTREGKVYCCVVLDAFSRFVVGWSIDSTQTTMLVLNALGMATQRRDHRDGLVIHSDRGVQFTSWAFSRRVRDAGIAPSMGAVGSPYDNAMVESFWGGCRSSYSTGAAGRPGSSSPPRSTTTSSTSTTPVAATRRSACSHPPKPKPDTLTLKDEPPNPLTPTDSSNSLHQSRGKSRSPVKPGTAHTATLARPLQPAKTTSLGDRPPISRVHDISVGSTARRLADSDADDCDDEREDARD